MAVWTLRVSLHLLTGFFLLSRILFISETDAAPFPVFKSKIQESNVDQKSLKQSHIGKQEPNAAKSFYTRNRQIASNVVGNGLDRVAHYMLALNNFVNGNTNIEKVDNYMAAFQNLMQAKGVPAMSIYSMVIMNFWVYWDSIAWFFRFNEQRLRTRTIEKIDNVRLANESITIENLIQMVNVTNLGLEALKKSMEVLLCQDGSSLIKRDGKINFNKNGQERQVDCSSILKRLDDKDKYLDNVFQEEEIYDDGDQTDEEGNLLQDSLDSPHSTSKDSENWTRNRPTERNGNDYSHQENRHLLAPKAAWFPVPFNIPDKQTVETNSFSDFRHRENAAAPD